MKKRGRSRVVASVARWCHRCCRRGSRLASPDHVFAAEPANSDPIRVYPCLFVVRPVPSPSPSRLVKPRVFRSNARPFSAPSQLSAPQGIPPVMAIRIKSRHGESVAQMLRRFKKLCEKEGLTKDVKRRQYYEKPSERARRDARRGAPRAVRPMGSSSGGTGRESGGSSGGGDAPRGPRRPSSY